MLRRGQSPQKDDSSIEFSMLGHNQLRHGREEELRLCPRATTTGPPGSDNYRTVFGDS